MLFDSSLRHRLRLSSLYTVCKFEANRSKRLGDIADLPKVIFAPRVPRFESSAGHYFYSSLEFQSSISRLPVGRFGWALERISISCSSLYSISFIFVRRAVAEQSSEQSPSTWSFAHNSAPCDPIELKFEECVLLCVLVLSSEFGVFTVPQSKVIAREPRTHPVMNSAHHQSESWWYLNIYSTENEMYYSTE